MTNGNKYKYIHARNFGTCSIGDEGARSKIHELDVRVSKNVDNRKTKNPCSFWQDFKRKPVLANGFSWLAASSNVVWCLKTKGIHVCEMRMPCCDNPMRIARVLATTFPWLTEAQLYQDCIHVFHLVALNLTNPVYSPSTATSPPCQQYFKVNRASLRLNNN